jgi:hypothetical protein
MSLERTFGNYLRLGRLSEGRGRYGGSDKREGIHNFQPKELFQRYGNSYIVSLPRKKILIFGPHWPGIVVTVFIIWGGTWLNLKMLRNHNEFSQFATVGFHIFIAIFFCTTHVLLFLTATSDPGIMFRTESATPDEETSLRDGEFCEVCQVFKPDQLRIHHCSDCNYCIEGMDHHCPWMVSSSHWVA